MNWTIERLYVKPVEGPFTNLVVTADWRVTGNQGAAYGTCYGATTFAPPDPEAFVQYKDLTLNQVLDWVFASGVDKAACEASVATQIQNQLNPPIITPPLPWN